MNEQSIFTAALERAPAERRGFLDDACGQDPGLRQRIERLIAAHDAHASFMDQPAGHLMPTVDQSFAEQPGSQIGPYKLLEQIGEGGFGLVFVAEQQQPVRRRVAVKVIKPGMDSKQVIARFEAERQALALMDHSNIARVLDAGTTESGRPYFVMELVRGIPITDYCDTNQLTPKERLELFVSVCHAIQHAHQKGIIHRDIKPSNVLVGSYDGKPLAKVIDFGVAKAISQELTQRTLYTNFAQMIGTPLYMSPEQADMSVLDIDTRSDIYSLGVLLYELLTGTTPLDKNRFARAAYDDIRRMIRDEEPLKPSQRLSTCDTLPSLAASRRTEPVQLSRMLKGELDWVVMKTLEKDRTRRYETASALARDIERYLDDEVVEARPPSASYRISKFVRRNRGQVIAAGLVLLALIVGVIGTTIGLIRAEKHRQLAEEQRQLAVAAQQAEVERADGERRARADAETARSRAEDQERLARRRYYNGQIALTANAIQNGQPTRALDFLETQRPGAGEEDLRGFEWHHLWYLVHRDRTHVLTGHDGGSARVSVTPDGRRLATADHAGMVRLWDAETGHLIRAWSAGPAQVLCHAFSSSGRQLACGDINGRISVWDVASNSEIGKATLKVACHSIVWLPGRDMILAACADATVRYVDAKGERYAVFKPHETRIVDRLLVSDDGKMLLTIHPNNAAILHDLSVIPPKYIRHFQRSFGGGFSPDGKSVAVGDYDKIHVYDIATGFARVLVAGQHGRIEGLAFSPDGKQLLSACFEDRSVLLWEVKNSTVLGRWASSHPINDVCFVMGGRGWAVSGEEGNVELWKPDFADEGNSCEAFISCAALIAADGATLLVSDVGALRRWDLEARKHLAPMPPMDGLLGLSRDGLCAISIRPPAQALRIADSSNRRFDEITVWDFPGSSRRFALPMKGYSKGAAVLAPNGKWVAAGNDDTPVTWWDISGRQPADPVVVGGIIGCLAVSPDSTTLAAGDENGLVRLWDIATRSETARAQHGPISLSSAAFSPDGNMLVTADEFGTIRFWESSTLRPIGMLQGNVEVLTMIFFPDGRTLACGRHDGTIQIVDAVTFQERMTWTAHGTNVVSLAVTADGGTLVSGALAEPFRIWRTAQAEH